MAKFIRVHGRRRPVVVIEGQSNDVGPLGSAALAPTVPIDGGLEYEQTTDTLKHLAEPVGKDWNPNANGCVGAAFCNAYHARTRRTPIIIHRAVGGTSQTAEAAQAAGHWDAGEATKYTQAVAAIDNALGNLEAWGIPHDLAAVIWDQGGQDAIQIDAGTPGVTVARYKEAFAAMVARKRAHYNLPRLPYLIAQLGRPTSGDTAAWLAIRTAQAELADELEDVYLSYTGAVDFPILGLQGDEYHYLQPGYNLIGTAHGNLLADITG